MFLMQRARKGSLVLLVSLVPHSCHNNFLWKNVLKIFPDFECNDYIKHCQVTYVETESWNFINRDGIHFTVPNCSHACQTCIKLKNLVSFNGLLPNKSCVIKMW